LARSATGSRRRTLSSSPESETALDEEYLGAIGQGNTNWFWTEPAWLYELAQSLRVQPSAQLPAVLSIRFGWYELQQCEYSPDTGPCSQYNGSIVEGSRIHVTAVSQLLAKVTARGVTLVVASGDSGAHSRSDVECTHPRTRAEFPSASPYVTSVGATELQGGGIPGKVSALICSSGTLACAAGGYEAVASNEGVSIITSGGGFSAVAPRPVRQETAVARYLSNASAVPPLSMFNASNRGTPDVSALGHNFDIQLNGSVASIDGTSASAPVFAGLVANLNAWRLRSGKPVLGFVNPLLYAIHAADPSAFNDVVQGDNRCTEAACPCPAKTGFFAAPGWDAASGLGTPNYGRIKAAIAAMGI